MVVERCGGYAVEIKLYTGGVAIVFVVRISGAVVLRRSVAEG
jgi:ethanolamine utilization microcompartment shell protein EutS